MHSPTKKFSSSLSRPMTQANPVNLPTKYEASTYLVVEISFVNGINQTGHPTNQQRPCTTIQ